MSSSVAPSRLILLLFLVAQFFDGVFTYVAVQAHGVQAEGNVVLGTWMSLIGPLPTLIAAKLLAASGGLLLYYVQNKKLPPTLATLPLPGGATADSFVCPVSACTIR